MAKLPSLIQKQSQKQLLLTVVLVLYIITNVNVPQPLAGMVDSTMGNIVVVLLALAVLLTENAVLGVLAVIAAFELIKRSSVRTGSNGIRRFLPSEDKKEQHFSALNQFPITLEEEMVHNMVPMVADPLMTEASYKPVMNASHNATDI